MDYRTLIMVMPPPGHHALKDERCWGKAGRYTVKDGYRVVGIECSSYNKDMKWGKIWNKDELPKINVFFYYYPIPYKNSNNREFKEKRNGRIA